ncbi:MAG: hypothetical protein JXA91_07555 [Candidatus Thermoplasmatota archaeon]|nr:hypothetical protein [Candidatus Thermoplasmatota archaeon]
MYKYISIVLILAHFTLCVQPLLANQRQKQSKVIITAVPFKNKTNDESMDHFASQIPDRIIAVLGGSGQLRIVDHVRLEGALGELKLVKTDLFDPRRAAEIGNKVGATAVIVGQISKWGENLFSIEAILVSVEDGTIIDAEVAQGSISQILENCDKIAFAFEKELVPPPPPPTKTIFSKWWFWALTAGVGAGIYFIASSSGGEEKVADVSITITLPKTNY